MSLEELNERKQKVLNTIIDLNLKLKKARGAPAAGAAEAPGVGVLLNRLAAAEADLTELRDLIDTAQKKARQRVLR
jgi:hypothetical protein